MIAKVKVGSNSGDVVYLTYEQFKSLFIKKVAQMTICTQQEAVWWGKNGRIGSRWQIDDDMYIMLKDKEDPFQYYNPSPKVASISSRIWGDKKSCGTGGCDSGCMC